MVIPVKKHLVPDDRRDVILNDKGLRKYGLTLISDTVCLWSSEEYSDKTNILQLDCTVPKDVLECIKCVAFGSDCKNCKRDCPSTNCNTCQFNCREVKLEIGLNMKLIVGDKVHSVCKLDSMALIMN